MSTNCVAITGAFSYSGKYTSKLLIDKGLKLITLTNHPDKSSPLYERLDIHPLKITDKASLVKSLSGADVLINTYWVRFSHKGMTHEKAVENTKILFDAAKEAGVKRIVHVSIANPSADSPLPYYKGKANLEQYLINTGLSYAIIRPTVIFGDEGILINNIAYIVRKFPVFAIPGKGDYKLQPIFVEDMAKILADAALDDKNYIIDAVGPDIYTFRELIQLIAGILGKKILLFNVPPSLAYLFTRILGMFVNDKVLTKNEIKGLMGNLLVSHEENAPGSTKLSEWLEQNIKKHGKKYYSEISRHY